MPYTMLSCTIAAEEGPYFNTAEIKLVVNNITVHHGLVDSISYERSGRTATAKIVSKGFTSLLCQNQIEPGMKTGVSINSLMESFYALPYITHEDNSDTSNYIYVKKNSSMWDGVVNLAYKLCGKYPYIRGTNCVRITSYPQPSASVYSAGALLSTGYEETYNNLVSNFHMADINDEYGHYDLEDSSVIVRKIVRHKFFELDMQFLQQPQDALSFRDKFCSRGLSRYFCTYSGYNGEDISDIVSFPSVSEKRISAVAITGSSAGIVTRLDVYYDKFL